MKNLDEYLNHARQLADIAAQVSTKHFRTSIETQNKAQSGFDPVTLADKNTEAAMRGYLAENCPDDGILGEEGEPKPSRSGYIWVLDPIDGTRSYVAGTPVWTTLISLVDREFTSLLGIIDQPILAERYVGWNTGACLETPNQKLIRTSSATQSLSESVIATTDPFIFDTPLQDTWSILRGSARITRYGLDGYAYAMLAVGGIDVILEQGLAPHDVAALIPIIIGAGGIITDLDGRKATAQTSDVLAVANQTLYLDVIRHI